MPPPRGPELACECYWGRTARVGELLASGADPMELMMAPQMASRAHLEPKLDGGVPLHEACFFCRVGCVCALLDTQCFEQLDVPRGVS